MPISPLTILGATLGAATLGAGVWLLREPKEGTRLAAISVPTRMATALVLLVAGYHLAAWSLPDSWTPMKIPPERWWLLAIGGAMMLSSSVVMDRRDRAQSRAQDNTK